MLLQNPSEKNKERLQMVPKLFVFVDFVPVSVHTIDPSPNQIKCNE
jgi:hypothetical protein